MPHKDTKRTLIAVSCNFSSCKTFSSNCTLNKAKKHLRLVHKILCERNTLCGSCAYIQVTNERTMMASLVHESMMGWHVWSNAARSISHCSAKVFSFCWRCFRIDSSICTCTQQWKPASSNLAGNTLYQLSYSDNTLVVSTQWEIA
jgi:hypothetical protein